MAVKIDCKGLEILLLLKEKNISIKEILDLFNNDVKVIDILNFLESLDFIRSFQNESMIYSIDTKGLNYIYDLEEELLDFIGERFPDMFLWKKLRKSLEIVPEIF